MPSTFRAIADALAQALDSVAWDISGVSVTRANWIELDANDMASPVVIVTPGAAEVTRAGRGLSQIDYSAHVFVGQHCETDEQVDAVMDLADAVLLHIRAHEWGEASAFDPSIKSPMTVSIEINPDDGLSERNVWRAMIVATYRVFESDTLPA